MRRAVGKRNKHCLCETCEKNGRGGYAPDQPEVISDSSDSDSDISSSSSDEESDEEEHLNLNERRTRRGVYAVAKDESSEESENDEDDMVPLARAKDSST